MTGKRILVVADQEPPRRPTRPILLTGSGYTVLEAPDAQADIATAKSDRSDLILMDIQMPVLDGYEVARQIKADPAFKATLIIAVSSFAMKGDEEKARAAPQGRVSLLHAPVSLFDPGSRFLAPTHGSSEKPACAEAVKDGA